MTDDPVAPEQDREARSPWAAVRGWLTGLVRPRNGPGSLRESLEEVIEEHEADAEALDPEERTLLMNILDFGDRRVSDVMVPRTDIVAIEAAIGKDELLDAFRDAAHSRLPVYRETLDNPLGMMHIKDMLRVIDEKARFNCDKWLRPVLFVPPSTPVLDLLQKMRATRLHMALVVDEYGGTDGLVTIEDLVEEIVGEIEDEHDRVAAPRMVERPDGAIDVDARFPLDEFEAYIDCDLLPDERDEDVTTLGGLVVSLAGRVPQAGETLDHPAGLVIEIREADARCVKRLRVRRAGEIPEAQGSASPATDGAAR